MKDLFAGPVEKDDGIKRFRIVCFKERDTDRHLKFTCKIAEFIYEITGDQAHELALGPVHTYEVTEEVKSGSSTLLHTTTVSWQEKTEIITTPKTMEITEAVGPDENIFIKIDASQADKITIQYGWWFLIR